MGLGIVSMSSPMGSMMKSRVDCTALLKKSADCSESYNAVDLPDVHTNCISQGTGGTFNIRRIDHASFAELLFVTGIARRSPAPFGEHCGWRADGRRHAAER